MKKFAIALIVLSLSTVICCSQITTTVSAPAAAVFTTPAFIEKIVTNHLGFFIQLAAENGEEENGDNGNGKEEEAGGNPLEGGVERVWNVVQLA